MAEEISSKLFSQNMRRAVCYFTLVSPKLFKLNLSTVPSKEFGSKFVWRQLNEGLFKLESLSLFSIERTLNALVLPATKWNKNNISFNNSSNNKSTRANTERGLSYIQIGISLVRDIDLFVNKNPTIHQMHDPTKRKGEFHTYLELGELITE